MEITKVTLWAVKGLRCRLIDECRLILSNYLHRSDMVYPRKLFSFPLSECCEIFIQEKLLEHWTYLSMHTIRCREIFIEGNINTAIPDVFSFNPDPWSTHFPTRFHQCTEMQHHLNLIFFSIPCLMHVFVALPVSVINLSRVYLTFNQWRMGEAPERMLYVA